MQLSEKVHHPDIRNISQAVFMMTVYLLLVALSPPASP